MPNRTIYHHAVAARERAHEFLAIAEACEKGTAPFVARACVGSTGDGMRRIQYFS